MTKFYDKMDAVRFTREFVKRINRGQQVSVMRKTFFGQRYLTMKVGKELSVIKVQDVPLDCRRAIVQLMTQESYIHHCLRTSWTQS